MLNYASQCLDTQLALSRLSPHVTESELAVLIVDDDPDVAPLVDRALRPYNICTEAVMRGVDAIARMRRSRYDLVVLDLAMGDVHGFDVLRMIRELPLNRDIPVLILTADGSHEAMARSFGIGADEFVKKPFDPRELGMRAFRLMRPFGQRTS